MTKSHALDSERGPDRNTSATTAPQPSLQPIDRALHRYPAAKIVMLPERPRVYTANQNATLVAAKTA